MASSPNAPTQTFAANSTLVSVDTSRWPPLATEAGALLSRLGDAEEVKRNAEEIKQLIKMRAQLDETNEDGYTALVQCSRFGCTEVGKLLLDKGAALNLQTKHGWPALHWATLNGHKEVAQLLLDKGAQRGMGAPKADHTMRKNRVGEQKMKFSKNHMFT